MEETSGSDVVLGIDLGTTNSAMAIYEGGEPEILENEQNERTTPSVVSVDDDGVVVGKEAKNRARKAPERTVTSIKRHMGSDFTVTLGGEQYDPEQISGFILSKLKNDAERRLGRDIARAVITVPAYFDDAQRKATKEAGQIAGLEVERIINEPTAAALAYGLDSTESEQRVLVYDLGGGTFDVSILRIGESVQEVITTDGDNSLGGDDWDEVLIDHFVETFLENHADKGVVGDIRSDPETEQRLKEKAEEVKRELSSVFEADVKMPFFAATETQGGVHLEQKLKRDTFEQMTEHLVERTVEPTERVIRDAPFPKSELDKVLLVGGSTRMPMIKEKVEELTGMEPSREINPDEAVALGAATQGGIMAGRVDEMVLLDVTPLSLGVEVKGGLFEPIIPRDTSIPMVESKPFTTAQDDQTQVQIRVFQGERDIAEENKFLGEFTLSGIPPAPAGAPEIEVRFKIDADGIVHVEAEDSASGKSEGVTLEGGTGLSEEEIEARRQEAIEFEEQDARRVQQKRSSQKANELAYSVRKELDSPDADQLPDEVTEEAEALLARVDQVDDSDSNSINVYQTLIKQLTSVLAKIREPDFDGTDEGHDSRAGEGDPVSPQEPGESAQGDGIVPSSNNDQPTGTEQEAGQGDTAPGDEDDQPVKVGTGPSNSAEASGPSENPESSDVPDGQTGGLDWLAEEDDEDEQLSHIDDQVSDEDDQANDEDEQTSQRDEPVSDEDDQADDADVAMAVDTIDLGDDEDLAGEVIDLENDSGSEGDASNS